MAYPLRPWCEILEDLRACFETRNFSYILGLIAELQYIGDRMELGLRGRKDIRDWEERRYVLDREIEELKVKKKGLEREIEDLTSCSKGAKKKISKI